MIPFSSKSVEVVFAGYPDHVRDKMFGLRDLIFTVSERVDIGSELAETLKWGEPSYVCKNGSTTRIHWSQSDPDFYSMFFHCQTLLVSTFRSVYPDAFSYQGNRAIRFSLSEDPDLRLLECCVEASLTYHLCKGLPDLGLTHSVGESKE